MQKRLIVAAAGVALAGVGVVVWRNRQNQDPTKGWGVSNPQVAAKEMPGGRA